MSEQGKSLSGLSAEEARAFHGLFVSSMVIFTVIATVAHVLVWTWKPWFQ
jgi:light-harvesting complex 1 beta chain